MIHRTPVLATLALLLLVSPLGPATAEPPALGSLIADALGSSPEIREGAIAALREMGASGMEAILPAAEEAARNGQGSALDTLDKVCALRGCASARLFWYTDLDAALVEARLSGKPVLSLRLLGRLDEDLSCANSRFFRTALYPDAAVGRYLREELVLHWQSVRPVPRVVVDYGDGRRLEGTLTGNSIHYVLDTQGRLVDALPGLYDPKTFLEEIRAARKKARHVSSLSDQAFASRARDLHRQNLRDLDSTLRHDLALVGLKSRFEVLKAELDGLAAFRSLDTLPTASRAAPRAMTKAIVQAPVLSRLTRSLETVEPLPGEDLWPRLAQLRRAEVHLDEGSRSVLRATHGMLPGSQADAVIETFEESLALDTLRNQQLLRRTLHFWLGQATAPPDLEAFNERVYGQLFLTPLSDPWLGLAPRQLYSGLAPVSQALVESGELGSGEGQGTRPN